MQHTSTIRIVGSEEDTIGVYAPDFLALGLGGTNMMSMLWTVVMGRRAVGVEMRGDPFLGEIGTSASISTISSASSTR